MNTLYAATFGRSHLGEILGLISTLTYLAIGASPVVFGAVHDQCGSFLPVLAPLVVWMPLAAAALAAAPPPNLPHAGGERKAPSM